MRISDWSSDVCSSDLRSCAGTTTAIRGAQCIDIDFTDPRVLRGDFTPEERAFLMGRETGRTLFKQSSAEALLTGKLFNLPGGPVGAAFGANLRRDEIGDTPGAAKDGRRAGRERGGQYV